jgi:hypothetical protein
MHFAYCPVWPRSHLWNASDSEDGGDQFSVSIQKLICASHQGVEKEPMINVPAQNLLNHGIGLLGVPNKVELIEDNLVSDTNTSQPVIECPQNLLDSYIELADADSETIRNFACRYGLLDLCKEHSLPFCHNLSFIYNGWVNPDRSCKPSGVEPIETWRKWARKFQAVLRIASKLSDRQPGDRSDWDLVLTDIDFGNEPFYWDDVEEIDTLPNILMEKELMQCLINQYLKLGGIRSWFYLLENEDDEIQPRLTIESSVLSLFAALVLRLVSRISQFEFKEEAYRDLELTR